MGRFTSPGIATSGSIVSDPDGMLSELLGVSKDDLPEILNNLTSTLFSATDSSWSTTSPARTSMAYHVTEGLSKVLESRSPMVTLISLASTLKRFKARMAEVKASIGLTTSDQLNLLDKIAMCVPEKMMMDESTDWKSLLIGPAPTFHPLVNRLL